VEALRYGEAERVVSLPAKFIAGVHGLFPGLTSDAFAFINTLLPDPAPEGENSLLRQGKDLETSMSKNFVTTLTDQAVEDNNEL
jgi:hypothetical protein